jgi:hypothetical protein
MDVLHQSAALPDVATGRREIKFLLGCQVDAVQRLLRSRLPVVRFGRADESIVSSIYFDDERLSSCEQSLAGQNPRYKLRLRWYDREAPAGDAFFEVKRRFATNVQKQRVPIRVPDVIQSQHELLAYLSETLDPALAARLVARPCPTVLVCYRRLHLRDPVTGTRCTIDRDIVGFDLFHRTGVERRFPVPLGASLLEVKLPADVRDLPGGVLTQLRLRPTRFSKYVVCASRMGWLQLSDHWR